MVRSVSFRPTDSTVSVRFVIALYVEVSAVPVAPVCIVSVLSIWVISIDPMGVMVVVSRVLDEPVWVVGIPVESVWST